MMAARPAPGLLPIPWFPPWAVLRLAAVLLASVLCLPSALAQGGQNTDRMPRATEPLIVFAAASLRNALDDALVTWQQASGALAVVSYAGTPTLARQIQAGAPADVFISADQLWMDTLAIDEKVRPDSIHIIARNRLALVAPGTAIPAWPGAAALSAAGQGASPRGVSGPPPASADLPITQWLGGTGRLAMADPESVPAGRYGRQALESIGWYARVQSRLTFSTNVRQALALVARGEVPLGIVYASDAAVEPKVAVVAVFEPDTHTPIAYPAARVAASRHPRGDEFLGWLRTPPAAAIFARYGFLPAQ